MSDVVIVHRPGVGSKGEGRGGLPLLLPQSLSQAFLAFQLELRELESQFTGSLTQRPG